MSRNRARALRRRLTDAERLLWRQLRRHMLGGFSFRKQAPIGPYVAEFVCQEHRLIVELDGGGHSLRTGSDRKRDAWLRGNGYRVLRFWNPEVYENMAGVLATILHVLEGRGGGSGTGIAEGTASGAGGPGGA